MLLTSGSKKFKKNKKKSFRSFKTFWTQNFRKKYLKKNYIYVNFMLIYVNITDRQTYQKYSSESHKI